MTRVVHSPAAEAHRLSEIERLRGEMHELLFRAYARRSGERVCDGHDGTLATVDGEVVGYVIESFPCPTCGAVV